MVSLFAAWLVMGLGMSCGLYEAAFSTLAGIYGRDARRAITGITLIAGFASTVCWPLSAYMDVTIGWRATCFAWAAAHLIIALPINLLLPPGRRHEPATASGAQEASPNRRMLVMAGLSCVFAAAWFGSTAMAAHLPRVLQEAGATLRSPSRRRRSWGPHRSRRACSSSG
jgi:predicted MFS family arabinose efflux permease